MSNEIEKFQRECQANIEAMAKDEAFTASSADWLEQSIRHRYSYNFNWMGRPIIQYPQDVVAMQEIIWEVQPDLIIETGIAHGGSLILYASLLAMLGGERRIIGIDIDIRAHNRREIEAHPMYRYITMIEASSVDRAVRDEVLELARGSKRAMVVLDANHTHDHVLKELRLYSPLVSPGSYMVVFDTVVEDLPADLSSERPWGPGDNPKTAVRAFLEENGDFRIEHRIQDKLQITAARDGYLKRVR